MNIPLAAEELLQALGRGDDVPMGVIADAFRDAGLEDAAEEVLRWRVVSREQNKLDYPNIPSSSYAFWSQRYWHDKYIGKNAVGETEAEVRAGMAHEIRWWINNPHKRFDL